MSLFSLALFFMAFMLVFDFNVLFLSLIVLVLIIHEAGHFLTMKLFNYKKVRLLFVPFMGAFVSGEKEDVSQTQRLAVILMGPLPGIILGTFLLYLGDLNQDKFYITSGLLFLTINVLNLVPIDPLDGGKVVETMFFSNQGQLKMYFALISSLFMIGIGYYYSWFILMAFGFLMAFRVRSIQKTYNMQTEMREQEVDFVKSYKDLTNREYWKIREIFINHTPILKDSIPSLREEWENESMLTTQVNNLLSKPIEKNLSVLGYVFVVILHFAAMILPLIYFYSLDLSWFLNEL
ncbi:MAG: site-2 protease family protein [Crocinitomicaceae bacterium]|nr:site-2 protease family protein [Crocinitomicaceae bacterium]